MKSLAFATEHLLSRSFFWTLSSPSSYLLLPTASVSFSGVSYWQFLYRWSCCSDGGWYIYIYNDALFSYIFIYCLIFSLFIVLLVHCRICYIDTSLRTLPANKVFLDSSCLQATFTRVIICIHVEILVSQEYACFFFANLILCSARDIFMFC